MMGVKEPKTKRRQFLPPGDKLLAPGNPILCEFQNTCYSCPAIHVHVLVILGN